MDTLLIGTAPKGKEPVDKNSEHYLLGGRPPLVTLLSLLAGPLFSQVTNSVYGLVESLWISKTHGRFGLTVTASIFVFDYITFACGEFMLIAVSSRISLLFSKNREKEAAKVVVDFIRYSFIFGAIIAAVLLPLVRVVAKWISNSDSIADAAFKYEIPILGCSFSQLLYLLGAGILEGEGRSMTAGLTQIICLCLIMFVFDPLFLVYFKMDLWGAALANVVAQALVGWTVLTLILSGKFSLKFKPHMFIEGFSKQSFRAIKVGFAAFMLNISGAFPEFAMQKFLALVADNVGALKPFLAVYDTFNRFYELGLCFMYSFDASFLPAASYAVGRRKYRRVHRLALHTLWITIFSCLIYSIFLVLFPGIIVSLWNDDEAYIYWAEKLFPFGYYTFALWPISSICLSYLESLELPGRATMLSIVTSFLPLPLASSAIYFFSKKNDLQLMFSAYIFAGFFQVLFSIPFIWKPCKIVHKTKDGNPLEGLEQHEETDGELLISTTSTDPIASTPYVSIN
ncbi:MatE family protein [Trichomonas vaginalis G3]|uniref:MatE family protein n=1 Tax=Trichomonas vaginalis (strain ATCC PRA-98 / G3) TaxID=412133 RepID=A2DYA5_TRIV3|nr:multidrug resistance protein YPNP-related family [Trichomonas vaginalis G3]EAY14582.1 MatE family protein [Trichomonas vaginalis G3]KAI5526593.1 multidrug resistance protein YPNP-related family [Trichomonas vaginalis G3]|eukprot:XP_001326805.1 MatE family protein [Trichomonas vaginalis G3]